MKCPFCAEENTKVIDSRPADDNNSIRRRRQCEKCGKRFTTYEKLETIPLVVIKKDRMREPYDRSKIERGVFRSCIKRPISVDQINELVDSVESAVFNLGEKEVESKKIGEILMDKLQQLDPVAYVRFASVYREFKDVNTFMDEIKKLLEKQQKAAKELKKACVLLTCVLQCAWFVPQVRRNLCLVNRLARMSMVQKPE